MFLFVRSCVHSCLCVHKKTPFVTYFPLLLLSFHLIFIQFYLNRKMRKLLSRTTSLKIKFRQCCCIHRVWWHGSLNNWREKLFSMICLTIIVLIKLFCICHRNPAKKIWFIMIGTSDFDASLMINMILADLVYSIFIIWYVGSHLVLKNVSNHKGKNISLAIILTNSNIYFYKGN